MRGDRTQKLYQRVHVVNQGKSCGDSDGREKHALTLEIVPGLVFQIIAGDLPKRWMRVTRITSAGSCEGDGMVVKVCDRRPTGLASCVIERMAAPVLRSR